jgi:hypothetical protein
LSRPKLRCPHCGEIGERAGHQGCLFPQDVPDGAPSQVRGSGRPRMAVQDLARARSYRMPQRYHDASDALARHQGRRSAAAVLMHLLEQAAKEAEIAIADAQEDRP